MLSNFERQVLQRRQGLRQARRARAEQARRARAEQARRARAEQARRARAEQARRARAEQARRARAEQALLLLLMIYNKKTLPNMQHRSNLTLKVLLLRLARLVVFQARSRSSSRLPRTRCLALPGGGGGGGGGGRRR